MAFEIFEEVPPWDPRAAALYEASRRVGAEALGLPTPDPGGASPDLELPGGVLLLVAHDGRPVAIGAVRDLDGAVAEIKAMYVDPTARRRGIAKRLLDRLEQIAVARGCEATRLDTLTALGAACALYESAGYARIPDYNGSPFADRWYERRLG